MNGRILIIFTTRSLIGSTIGAGIGFGFYYFLKTLLGMNKLGLILILVFAAIGYLITTVKIPENSTVPLLKLAGGERIDSIIFRAIKFKAKGKRIYLYTKEENKK